VQQRLPPHSRIQSRRILSRRSDDSESFRRRPPARFAEPRQRRQSDTSPTNPQRGLRSPALRAVKLPPIDTTRSTGCMPPALCAVRFAPDLKNARVGLTCRRRRGQPAPGARLPTRIPEEPQFALPRSGVCLQPRSGVERTPRMSEVRAEQPVIDGRTRSM
jgi:hypothetical protein